MALCIDEAHVYKGQLLVCDDEIIPKALGVAEGKITGSSFIQGPVQIGDDGSYSEVEATLMVGPDTNDESPQPPKSLRVNGDVDIIGDTTQLGNTKQTGTVDATTFIGAHAKGSISTNVSGRSSGAKPFDMPHPTKDGYRLRYVCVEGPENGVYFRGRVVNKNVIYLPDYWKDLVHQDSITIQLQPIGDRHYHLSVVEFTNEYVIIKESDDKPIDCFYHVYAERKDVGRLVVEYKGDKVK